MWLSRARWLEERRRRSLYAAFFVSQYQGEKASVAGARQKSGLEIRIFTRWRIGNCGADPGGAWQRLDVTGCKTQGNLHLLAEMKVERRIRIERGRFPRDAVIADMRASPYGPYGGCQPLERP